ncbi:MAG: NAD(P)H-hydrate dehydratase, partial [Eggerthellaceae bacterium]|nr:NAD(P)H-hydrate dehydratase [Eggerthellaceae bacterium]
MPCRSVKYSSFDLKKLLPWPGRDAHKYSRGKLVVVAGCKWFPGAAVLAAIAGQRMGAGYVEVHCAPEAAPVVQAAR